MKLTVCHLRDTAVSMKASFEISIVFLFVIIIVSIVIVITIIINYY